MKKADTINTIEDEAETYFIQFIFMKNRDLLRKNYHGLYDALFERYVIVNKKRRKEKFELFDINKLF